MRQVLQYRRSGKTRVVDVPAPSAPEAGVLVQTRWSLISAGTERMVVEAGGSNLLKTAQQRPDLVRQVVDKARREGVAATLEVVKSRLDVAIPLGYSCAGVVVESGAGAAEFAPGQRVACAGAGQANHAEFVAVPRRLVVPVPENVALEDAAFVTLGAIALQGVRIADVRVGESCVVIGLGLVGQLTVQLLKAAGCRVFGIDVAADKAKLAVELGADAACVREDASLEGQVHAFTQGRGADAILITAATSSSDPVRLAADLARDRAVVVAVGLVGMDVPRNAYYEKELDLRLSRSYGPGRYDATYEKQGVDYPLGYVRWTEQRNMEAFLDLVSQGKVQPSRLVTHRIPVEEAERAYAIVTGAVQEPYLGILLRYREDAEPARRVEVPRAGSARATGGAVRFGVVGAGNFARGVLLPRLKEMSGQLTARGVATASGPSARQTAERYGFTYATTDWSEVVEDAETDAVLIATRHDQHARVAAAALRAGKAVFLEKPMALREDELADLLAAWEESGRRPLLVGFNRRFAPSAVKLKEAVGQGPLVMQYRVNAGSVPPSSWVLDPVQGGGRLIGEVCHMVDLMCFVADAPVRRVHALASGADTDDVVVALGFTDGSVGTVTYAAGGDRSLPKEYLEVIGGGRAAVLDDFQRLTVHEQGRVRQVMGGRNSRQDKGHAAEVEAFVQAVRSGGPSPIDPRHAAHVTRVTFAAVESVRTGLPVEMDDTLDDALGLPTNGRVEASAP